MEEIGEKSTLRQPTRNADEKRDWAALLPELIQVIATKVTEIIDFIRFRAICKTWRSLVTITDLSPQFPWIIFNRGGPNLCFYSIVLKKSFTIHAPKFSNKYFFEPCCGYMLVHSKDCSCQVSLINPLTDCEISLPPLDSFHHKWVGSRNFKSGDYVICKDFQTSFQICKPGDKKWVYQEITNEKRVDQEIPYDAWVDQEITYDRYYLVSNNLLFMIDNALHRSTKVIDIEPYFWKTLSVVPPPKDSSTSLINISSNSFLHPILIEAYGEIMCVIYISQLKKFEIYRLEAENGMEDLHWVQVRSIGERMLFIDISNRYGHCIPRAVEFDGLKLNGNCIYLIRKHTKISFFQYSSIVERYDIDSETMEHIHCPEGEEFTWYFPSLNGI